MALTSLAVAVLVWLVGFALRALNLRHLRRHGDRIPAGFETAIDGERLRRASAYTLAHGRLSMIEDLVRASLWALFLFGGLLGRYDAWVARLELPLVIAGLVFGGGLLLVDSLLALPFGWRRTFGVETAFGFNTTSPRLWWLDRAKGLGLNALLGVLVTVTGLLLITGFPRTWWLALWLFTVTLTVLLQFLAPVVIEPLFHVRTPVQDAALRRDVEALACRAGCQVSRVLQVDASRRSRHANAFFAGIGRVKRVVLDDTLLTTLGRDEILAVLAHELAHWRRHHVLRHLLLLAGASAAGCLLAWQLVRWPKLPGLVGLAQASLLGRLLIAGTALSLLGRLLAPVASRLSRRYERQADDDAVALLGDPAPLARALRALARDNLANLHPHPWYAALYYTHPPVVERVQGLLARRA